MRNWIKAILVMAIALSFVSCGTMMERRTEMVTVSSNVKGDVKLYLNYQPIGVANQVYVANTGWSKDTLMAENVKTGEKRIVPLDYGFNGWFIGSFFLPFGVIIDLVTGSVTDLGRKNYYVNFNEPTEPAQNTTPKTTKTTTGTTAVVVPTTAN